MANPKLYELEVFDLTLVALLGLGDRVLVDWSKGRIQESGTAWRIVKRRLVVNSDTLVVTLNPVVA